MTGCTSGLGAALCAALAAAGRDVAATARGGPGDARLRRAVADAPAAATGGARVRAFQLDVTDADSVAACVERVVAELGDVDELYASAGLSRFGPLLEQPVERVAEVMDANVYGVLRCVQAVVPSMCERRCGKVLIVGSVSAALTTPFAGAYSASKAAVHELAEALRMEVARFGVSVSVAVLGSFKSDFSASAAKGMEGVDLKNSALYGDVAEKVEARTFASQSFERCQSAATVAQDLVRGMRASRPPAYIPAAGGVQKYRLMGFLQKNLWPWTFIQGQLTKAFGLD